MLFFKNYPFFDSSSINSINSFTAPQTSPIPLKKNDSLKIEITVSPGPSISPWIWTAEKWHCLRWHGKVWPRKGTTTTTTTLLHVRGTYTPSSKLIQFHGQKQFSWWISTKNQEMENRRGTGEWKSPPLRRARRKHIRRFHYSPIIPSRVLPRPSREPSKP